MSLSHAYEAEDYKRIIDIICEKHDQYNHEWLSKQEDHVFNLKSKQVRHVTSNNPDNMHDFINQDFLEHMQSYQEGLYDFYADVVLDLAFHYKIPIIGRVKNDDSIVSKLHRKRFNSSGSFSINKYLNDLLGFRIIDQNFSNNIHEVKNYIDYLNNYKTYRIRENERQANDYKAYHVYSLGFSNNCFPVELQIWDAQNERSNLDSHKIYKKDYTYWPTKYRDG